MPAPTGQRPPDPVVQGRYKVDFPKLSGVFSAVDKASAVIAEVPYQFNGPDGQPSQTTQPGLRKNPQIKLTRGMTDDLSAWNWHKEVINGQVASARVNGTISILNTEGQPVAVFNVFNAWPLSVAMPALQSSGTTAGNEIITLTCEGFERAQ